MATKKLTKQILKTIAKPESHPTDKPLFYFDTEIKGFGIKVTKTGRVSYIVDKRIQTRKKRFTIGNYPSITLEIAKQEAQNILSQIAKGEKNIQNAVSPFTIHQITDEFITYYKKQIGQTIKTRTFESFQETTKHFTKINTIPIKDLSFSDIETLKHTLKKKGHSNRTINIHLTGLNKLLDYAIRKEYISHKPKIDRLSEQKKQQIDSLTQQQVKDLLNLTDNENIKFYIQLMVYFGIRPYEMLMLKWEDIDLNQNIITIHSDNKLKKGRKIPISDQAKKVLQPQKQKTGYVSPYRTTSGARKILTRLGQKLNIKCTPYILRKTFGSLMAESGQESFIIGKIMGHQNIKTTYQYYIDIETEKMRSPMNSLNLDSE